jgi:hypothetical protein
MKKIFLVTLTALSALLSTLLFAQESFNIEAELSGKTIQTQNTSWGQVVLTFEKGGKLYGNNNGGSDSGKWEVQGDKLCLHWRRWDYEGCGNFKKEDNTLTHYYPNSELIHFKSKLNK